MAVACSAKVGGSPGRRTSSAPTSTAATISPSPSHRVPRPEVMGVTPISARLAAMSASVSGP